MNFLLLPSHCQGPSQPIASLPIISHSLLRYQLSASSIGHTVNFQISTFMLSPMLLLVLGRSSHSRNIHKSCLPSKPSSTLSFPVMLMKILTVCGLLVCRTTTHHVDQHCLIVSLSVCIRLLSLVLSLDCKVFGAGTVFLVLCFYSGEYLVH